MKSFKTYLTESTKVFSFKFKIAAFVSEAELMNLENALKRFKVIMLSKPRTTPIQALPMDFTNIVNAEVTIFDVILQYPATTQILEELVHQTLCLPKNHICIRTITDPREENEELVEQSDDKDYVPLVTQGLPPSNPKIKELYGQPMIDKYMEKINDYSSKNYPQFKVAGGETPPAHTSWEFAEGTKSAVGSTKNKIPVVKSNAR